MYAIFTMYSTPLTKSVVLKDLAKTFQDFKRNCILSKDVELSFKKRYLYDKLFFEPNEVTSQFLNLYLENLGSICTKPGSRLKLNSSSAPGSIGYAQVLSCMLVNILK